MGTSRYTHLLAFFAHPGVESFGVEGVLAKHAAAGAKKAEAVR